MSLALNPHAQQNFQMILSIHVVPGRNQTADFLTTAFCSLK
jgi:hypothetical protein